MTPRRRPAGPFHHGSGTVAASRPAFHAGTGDADVAGNVESTTPGVAEEPGAGEIGALAMPPPPPVATSGRLESVATGLKVGAITSVAGAAVKTSGPNSPGEYVPKVAANPRCPAPSSPPPVWKMSSTVRSSE